MLGGPAEVESGERLIAQAALPHPCCPLEARRDCAGDGCATKMELELEVARREARHERTEGRMQAWEERRGGGTASDGMCDTLRCCPLSSKAHFPACSSASCVRLRPLSEAARERTPHSQHHLPA